jgi:hypothetical protein
MTVPWAVLAVPALADPPPRGERTRLSTGPSMYGTLGPDRASVGFDQSPGNGQPQARAARIACLRETLEELRQHVWRDARSVVGDGDGDTVAIAPPGDAHDTPRRRVTKRVGDQIGEHLADAQGVQTDERQVARHRDLDLRSDRFGESPGELTVGLSY